MADDATEVAMRYADLVERLGESRVKRTPTPATVWVILPDYHCDGLSEPIAAFRTKSRADQAMALLAHGHQSFKLVEVEIQDA